MQHGIFHGQKVLITAGPSREAIDPVRYISNHSSGKMGYALAEHFLSRGAEVFLISGPVPLSIHHRRLQLVKAVSAGEMYLPCCKYFESVDIAVFAAAVADYRPMFVAEKKIKKNDPVFQLKMVKNIDIAYEFSQIKSPRQISVGFALETNDEMTNAMSKLKKKNFDMIVLNSMNDDQSAFGFDTNKVTIIKKDGCQKKFTLKSKPEVAADILFEIGRELERRYYHEPAVLEYESMYR